MKKIQEQKWLGSYGTCPDCGGQTIETAVGSECKSCDYYQYYGGSPTESYEYENDGRDE